MMKHSMGGLPLFVFPCVPWEGRVLHTATLLQSISNALINCYQYFSSCPSKAASPWCGGPGGVLGQAEGQWWEQSWWQHSQAPLAAPCCSRVDWQPRGAHGTSGMGRQPHQCWCKPPQPPHRLWEGGAQRGAAMGPQAALHPLCQAEVAQTAARTWISTRERLIQAREANKWFRNLSKYSRRTSSLQNTVGYYKIY